MIKLLPLILLLCSCSGLKYTESCVPLSGKEIISFLDTLSLGVREDAILEFVKKGNIPEFLNCYQEIVVLDTINGNKTELKYYVSPDYFSLGNNSGYFLTPVTPLTAQKIADHFNCILPTAKMSDQIYKASEIKYNPQPIKPSPGMITIKVFADHNDSIIAQRKKYFNDISLTALSAGHKKDVVISNSIYTNLKTKVPKPVVIYGWHKLDGKPIQPLYNGHDEKYADYSHGIRLIKRSALLNGKEVDLVQILKDSILCNLISGEGVIDKAYYEVKCLGL